MLDLAKYDSLGAALRDALGRWPEEVCLIEADRDHERSRLTYRQFGEAAEPRGRSPRRIRVCRGRSRRDHHDQSAQVADFGLRRVFRGRRSCSARLQALRRRTSSIARALKSPGSVCRIPAVARHHASARVSRAQTANGARDRSAAKCRSRGRRALGGDFAARARPNSGRARKRTRPASSIRPAREATPGDAC